MGNIVAIVGRPNVGKSTLYNRLIGERQAIIDDESGVTRDRKYGMSEWNGKKFTVIDTGGFVHGSDDVFESAIRSQVRVAIEEATLMIFLVDVTTGITDLDEEVAQLLRKTEKPVILVVNKVDNHRRMLEANEFWSMGFEHTHFLSSLTGSGTGEVLDLVTELIQDEPPIELDIPKFAILGQPYEQELRAKIAPFNDVPIIFTSVVNKQRILKSIEIALEVHENRNRKIKTSALNDFMLEAIDRNPPPSNRGRFAKIKFITQLPTYYPAFAFFCNNPKYIKTDYKNFLENQLRKEFNFTGVPIGIFFRQK